MTQLLVAHEKPTRYRNLVAKVTPRPASDADDEPDVIARITTDIVDDDREVVLPGGADLSRFRLNPIIMLCHAYGRPGEYYPLPVGKAIWTRQEGNGLVQGIRFSRETPMGRQVLALFAEKMLRTFSIGFTSLEASAPTKQELARRPDWRDAVVIHRRWKLLEVSVVPIPCNVEAIGVYQAKGRKLPSFVQLPQSRAAAPARQSAAALTDRAARVGRQVGIATAAATMALLQVRAERERAAAQQRNFQLWANWNGVW